MLLSLKGRSNESWKKSVYKSDEQNNGASDVIHVKGKQGDKTSSDINSREHRNPTLGQGEAIEEGLKFVHRKAYPKSAIQLRFQDGCTKEFT